MGGKLTDTDMDQLEQWIGTGPKTFTLLYSINRDGCNSTAFHNYCDNKGATVTVLYNPSNSVYGGYTAVNWSSNNQNGYDGNAFLFQLHFSGKPNSTKFPVASAAYGIYTHSSYGPTFGAATDLVTFTNTVQKTGTHFTLNGSMAIGNYFSNPTGVTVANINNGNMNVTELEVYAVANGVRVKKPEKPWRKCPDWNDKLLESLKEDILNVKPSPDLKVTDYRVLMLGPIGSGKSSFVNTITSIFKDRISQRARSGNTIHSITTAYTPYSISSRSGGTVALRLCDTRGLEETQGIDILECNSLLDGHVSEHYEFNPAMPITMDNSMFVKMPCVQDKVHCVVYVIDGTTVENISDKLMDKMKSFQKLMNQKGIPQVVLLTKVDKVCGGVEESVANVFRSVAVEKAVDRASELMGLPRNNILPVKNYENEMEPDDNISILALLALRQILYFTEDYMENLLEKRKVKEALEDKCNKKE